MSNSFLRSPHLLSQLRIHDALQIKWGKFMENLKYNEMNNDI